jgi:hypothetical protein
LVLVLGAWCFMTCYFAARHGRVTRYTCRVPSSHDFGCRLRCGGTVPVGMWWHGAGWNTADCMLLCDGTVSVVMWQVATGGEGRTVLNIPCTQDGWQRRTMGRRILQQSHGHEVYIFLCSISRRICLAGFNSGSDDIQIRSINESFMRVKATGSLTTSYKECQHRTPTDVFSKHTATKHCTTP